MSALMPLNELLERTKANGALAKQKKALEKAGAAAMQRQMLLFPEDWRALSNDLARSPLFAAMRFSGKAKREVFLEPQLLASFDGVSIRFKGTQLDQGDCDVFMEVVHIASGRSIGGDFPIIYNRNRMLQSIERDTGGENYAWLEASLSRLNEAKLIIELHKQDVRIETYLILKITANKRTGEFRFMLDPQLVELFADQRYTLIDWEKRKSLKKRADLAKWLQTYTCSHKQQEQHWSVKTLLTLSGIKLPIWKFMTPLEEALGELERVGILARPVFYQRKTDGKSEPMVKWTRLSRFNGRPD